MSQDYLCHEQTATNNAISVVNDGHHDQALTYLQEKLDTFGKKLQEFSLLAAQYFGNAQIINREMLFEQQYNREQQREYL